MACLLKCKIEVRFFGSYSKKSNAKANLQIVMSNAKR